MDTGAGAWSCPPHRHGKHAGEICFWSLSQRRLALHYVVNGFGDVGRMIAHALKILCTKHQVSAEGHSDGLFRHVSEKLLRQTCAQPVDVLVPRPNLNRLRGSRVALGRRTPLC